MQWAYDLIVLDPYGSNFHRYLILINCDGIVPKKKQSIKNQESLMKSSFRLHNLNTLGIQFNGNEIFVKSNNVLNIFVILLLKYLL